MESSQICIIADESLGLVSLKLWIYVPELALKSREEKRESRVPFVQGSVDGLFQASKDLDL